METLVTLLNLLDMGGRLNIFFLMYVINKKFSTVEFIQFYVCVTTVYFYVWFQYLVNVPR